MSVKIRYLTLREVAKKYDVPEYKIRYRINSGFFTENEHYIKTGWQYLFFENRLPDKLET